MLSINGICFYSFHQQHLFSIVSINGTFQQNFSYSVNQRHFFYSIGQRHLFPIMSIEVIFFLQCRSVASLPIMSIKGIFSLYCPSISSFPIVSSNNMFFLQRESTASLSMISINTIFLFFYIPLHHFFFLFVDNFYVYGQ